MAYVDVFKKVLEIRRHNFWHMTRYYYLCIIFSALVTPLTVRWGISANTVTYVGALIGISALVGFVVLDPSQFYIPVLLYYAYYLIDSVDGDTARVTGKSTFFGRYLDGMVDILIDSLILLPLGFALFRETGNEIWLWVGAVTCFVSGVAHLGIDRYSAFRRWIKEEHGVDVGDHSLPSFLTVYRTFSLDLQMTSIVLIAFWPFLGSKLLFLSSFAWNFILLLFYMIRARQRMYLLADRPKHGGLANEHRKS